MPAPYGSQKFGEVLRSAPGIILECADLDVYGIDYVVLDAIPGSSYAHRCYIRIKGERQAGDPGESVTPSVRPISAYSRILASGRSACRSAAGRPPCGTGG